MSASELVTPDPLLVSTLERLFSQTCTHEAIQAAEANGWAEDIWTPLAGTGAPWVGVPEDRGGSGGTMADAVAVLRACGRHAVPLPVAETGLLGGWLAVAAGIELPEGPLTVAPQRPDDTIELRGDRVSGVLHRVPWARRAELILFFAGGRLVAVEPGAAGVELELVRNVAGEPRETVRLSGVTARRVVDAPEGVDAVVLRRRGALCRAALIAGALDRIAALTVEYANQRVQFGQKIARFQAVAQHLVRLASETQIVSMAVDASVAALATGDAAFEVAALKVLAGEAGSEVVARSHQVHGAIGMTQEYVLHQLTRRVWSWREEFGSTAWWRDGLGGLVAQVGADGLWPLISEGSASLAASSVG